MLLFDNMCNNFFKTPLTMDDTDKLDGYYLLLIISERLDNLANWNYR